MAQIQNDYIAVDNGQTPSFGGNQSWLNAPSGRGRVIAGYGCGIIAAADLFWYLARYHEDAKTPVTAPVEDMSPVARDAYLNYIHAVERGYVRAYNHIGMTGFALSSAVNRYFADHRLNYRARWAQLLLDGDRAQRTIRCMLDADLPVVISIPGTVLRSRALRLFGSAHTELPREKERAYHYAALGGHFVTITGMTQNGCGDPVFEIASWGRKYYLDLADYIRALKRPQGVLVCGLLAVEPAAHPPRRLTVRVRL